MPWYGARVRSAISRPRLCATRAAIEDLASLLLTGSSQQDGNGSTIVSCPPLSNAALSTIASVVAHDLTRDVHEHSDDLALHGCGSSWSQRS